MAAYTITITNSIRCFGPAPSCKWGASNAMLWGSSKWGEGTVDLITGFLKIIGNSIGSDSTTARQVGFFKTVTNTITPTEDLSSESITNGLYTYVFPGGSSNAENRVLSTYSTATAGTQTYSSGIAGTTTWS